MRYLSKQSDEFLCQQLYRGCPRANVFVRCDLVWKLRKSLFDAFSICDAQIGRYVYLRGPRFGGRDEIGVRRTRAAMENDRQSARLRDKLDAFRVYFLLCAAAQDAVHVADRRRQKVYSRLAREMRGLFGVSKIFVDVGRGRVEHFRTAAYHAEFAFQEHVAAGGARIRDGLSGLFDVLFEREVAAVENDRVEPRVDGLFDLFNSVGVIGVQIQLDAVEPGGGNERDRFANPQKFPLAFGNTDHGRHLRLPSCLFDGPELVGIRDIKVPERDMFSPCLLDGLAKGLHVENDSTDVRAGAQRQKPATAPPPGAACYNRPMRYDFVAIGDITTDCFIKLKDAEEMMNHDVRELCVRFGDKVPFEEAIEVRAVGNAANAAVAARRIGLSSALIARVGDDQNGKNCRETLTGNGVSDEYVETQLGQPTNYHYVLWFGPERTILVKQNTFSYSMPQFEAPPKYIYLTSLGESAKEFHHEVAKYVAEHPETKLVFQPGTFQIKLGAEELKDVYAVTEIFFCNKEEAQTILKTTESDVKKLMESLRALGPKIVVLTDGPKGSNILEPDGNAYHAPMYPDPAPPVSRTGAGDATASTTVAFIELGLAPREALLRGLINAASVVQGVGAQTKLLSKEDIEAWYAKRPTDFNATPLA